MSSFPVIGAIRTFDDVRRSLENIRNYFNKQGGLDISILPSGNAAFKIKNNKTFEVDESWTLGLIRNESGNISTTESIEAVISGRKIRIPILSGNEVGSGSVTPALPSHAIGRAYLSGNQSVTAGNTTVVNIDTESFNNSVTLDANNHTLTPLVEGYYQVNAMVTLSTVDGAPVAELFKNGNVMAWGVEGNNCYGGSVSDIIYFNGSNDYVDIRIYVVGNRTALAGTQYTFLSLGGPF